METNEIIVIGKVQGVAFRYNTKLKADELGVRGFVKNREDGAVEINAIADARTMKIFIDWCMTGSPAARVEEIFVSRPLERIYSESFDIIR
jgi:acylphosphatase